MNSNSKIKNKTFPKYNNYMNDTMSKDNNKNKSKQKCKPTGRDQKIEPDLYFMVKEENELLKKDKLAQDKIITELKTSLANIKENIIRERRQADYKVINSGKNFNSDLEKTKYENEKLKFENKKKNLIIQGLQSNTTLNNKKKQKSKNKTKLRGAASTTPINGTEKDILISQLREQLKIAQDDRHKLITEIHNLMISNSTKYNNINGNGMILPNNSSYNPSGSNVRKDIELDTKKKVLEMTKKNLEMYIDKYEKERDNNRKLQTELSILRGEVEKIDQYKTLIDDLKNNERKLEEELNDLRINPFIKETEERGNVFRNNQITEKRLEETKKLLNEKEKELQEKEIKLKELEKENKKLKDNNNILEIDKEKYKEEYLKLKISEQERENTDKIFQDKLNQFVQYGQIDPNFARMLSLVKAQNSNLNWSNINTNYLEQNQEKSNDPIYLKGQIEKLMVEKSELGKELETTKALLITQQQINDDTKLLQEIDNKKYQAEVKLLKQKIEDLLKLIDVNKLPNEFLTQDPITGKAILKDKNELLNELIPTEKKDVNLLDDNITEFSQDETDVELTMNENALDIFFGECIYEDGLGEELGFAIEHMLSFFSVDFFIHETQTSDILNGKTPLFNFQLTFKVDVNENLINYLESEFIYLDIYSLRDNVQTIFGKGKISLKELIEVEISPESTKRVINSICSLYYIKDPNLKIASLHYKMRMRKPLNEALKWYTAQNAFIRQKNPIHDVIITNAEKSIKNYANSGGEAYDVKIHISKAVGLVSNNLGGGLSPYFYYKFYKDGEKYSQISSGIDPLFEDVSSFKEMFTREFADYIENENLNVYLFDGMNPIEVDINDRDQIKLINTNQEISKDLIGICRIPLKGLLINNLVQGEFPIISINNQKVGVLHVNIFWEKMNYGGNEGMYDMPYETEKFKDALIIKLSNVLKAKGLNLDSAFNIFDMDRKNEITIENFKDILIYTLKFSTNQNEIESLIKLLFTNESRNVLTKTDFFRIFSMLLPHDGPASSVLMASAAYQNDNEDKKYETNLFANNQMISNMDSQFSINAEKQRKNSRTQNINYINNNIGNTTNINNINNQTNIGETTSVVNTNRSLEELGKLVFEYRMKMGGDFSQIFKDLDKDGSLGIDKKELRNGYQKMGISLSDTELNKLWRELSPDNQNIDFARFKAFHEKLFVPNTRKGIPIKRDQMDERGNTMISNN